MDDVQERIAQAERLGGLSAWVERSAFWAAECRKREKELCQAQAWKRDCDEIVGLLSPPLSPDTGLAKAAE